MPSNSVVLQRLAIATLLPFLITGCDREDTEIKVYKVAKADTTAAAPAAPNRPTTPSAPPVSGAPAAGESRSQIIGSTPEGWEAQPPSQMRQASFQIRGQNDAVADVSLIILGGNAGGDLSNVNRWRQQLGLAPWTDAEFAAAAQKITAAIGEGILVDLNGLADGADPKSDGRIVAAIIPKGEETWFFKMRGNADLAAAQTDPFRHWVEMVRVGSVNGDSTATPQTQAPPVAWKLPAGWQPGAPAPMRFATFTAPGPDGTSADISVVTFPGDSGGDLANVNRWLGQLGLPATDEAGLAALITPVPTAEATLKTVDFEKDGNRMLAGWTQHDGRSWFFKMTGPNDLLETQKPNFDAFLKSLHFHH